jgi:hypothetical protein
VTSGSPETLNNPDTPDRVQKESIEEIADRINYTREVV